MIIRNFIDTCKEINRSFGHPPRTLKERAYAAGLTDEDLYGVLVEHPSIAKKRAEAIKQLGDKWLLAKNIPRKTEISK